MFFSLKYDDIEHHTQSFSIRIRRTKEDGKFAVKIDSDTISINKLIFPKFLQNVIKNSTFLWQNNVQNYPEQVEMNCLYIV